MILLQIARLKQACNVAYLSSTHRCSQPRLKPIRSYMGGKSGGCLSTLVCYVSGEGQRRTVPEEAVFCGSRIGMN